MTRTFGFVRATLPAWSLALAAVSGAACFGRLGGSHDPPKAQAAIPAVTHSRFPRLSHRQWESTVQDLLHLPEPSGLSSGFYPDPLGGKTFDNDEASLEVTPELWQGYQSAAETLAKRVMDDATVLGGIVPPNLPSDSTAKRDAFVRAFGARAFRRPLTNDEAGAFDALFDEAVTLDTQHSAFVAGVGLVVEAMLESPYFVYRAELSSTPSADGLIHLSGYEIATKLSYALWNTMPDDPLLDAARSGALDSVSGLEAKAAEMLGDPRAGAMLQGFHHRLYQVDQYANMPAKDPTAYPDFAPALLPEIAKDMQTEADLVIEDAIVARGGGLAQLLTSKAAYVNSRLAGVYGLDAAGRVADRFDRVELDEKRPGLFTRSGFLAWKGRAVEPDTIMRGVFVNRRLLCQKLGDPPPAAAGAMLGHQATDRARVEALTGKGTCGETCHGTYIDPIGYGFEAFDAIGRYRTTDEGFPVDASATFPFDGKQQRFGGVADLVAIIASSKQANDCYASYWMEFLHGRALRSDDQPEVEALGALSKHGGGARDLVLHVIASDSFRTRTVSPEVGQ